jgi:hypothetical protein
MDTINEVVERKTNKKDLKPQINEIFKIAENPALNFKRYTIGFDANCLSFKRK